MLSMPRQKSKKFLALLTFTLAMTSCSGSSDSAEPVEANTPASSGDETENSDSSEEVGENPDDADVTEDVEVADEPALPMANGVEMVQLTEKSGGGPRPMLAWEPVSEAASYTVVVYDADGAPWWSWAGDDTKVVIGGVATDTEIGGPRAVEGARWTVMAFDPEGNLVGASPKRSIQP